MSTAITSSTFVGPIKGGAGKRLAELERKFREAIDRESTLESEEHDAAQRVHTLEEELLDVESAKLAGRRVSGLKEKQAELVKAKGEADAAEWEHRLEVVRRATFLARQERDRYIADTFPDLAASLAAESEEAAAEYERALLDIATQSARLHECWRKFSALIEPTSLNSQTLPDLHNSLGAVEREVQNAIDVGVPRPVPRELREQKKEEVAA